MPTDRFDVMTRALAAGAPRRQVVTGMLSLAFAGLIDAITGHTAFARGTPQSDEPASYLFVQSAKGGGTLLPTGEPDRFTLTLTGVSARTIYFSNIGGVLAGTLRTALFVDELPTLFEGHPNAALSLSLAGQDEGTLILTLLSGSHDAAGSRATYEVQLLEDSDSPGLAVFNARGQLETVPEQFDEAHLFIDNGNTPPPHPCICSSDDDLFASTCAVDNCSECVSGPGYTCRCRPDKTMEEGCLHRG